MEDLNKKFEKLGVDHAPGQESLQTSESLPALGEPIPGKYVDFSHGDVDAFEPIPGSLETFMEGYRSGGRQAYTEYRGKADIRQLLAQKLTEFSGAPVDYQRELMITPGTQGALFLAMGALVGRGDKVAIVEPDYFANRKLVEFFDGEIVPISIRWRETDRYAGLDLSELEAGFKAGVKLFLYSNPNNPTGVTYSPDEVAAIGRLAKKYKVAVIADELYSRQLFEPDLEYTHLRSLPERPEWLITIIGPSKTESLSGYRLGVAYGSEKIIARMEKLQAIVSLRAAGYSQAVLRTWFSEPEGWLAERIAAHKKIRDDILAVVSQYPGCWARRTEGGSYLFLQIPPLAITLDQFVKLCRVQAAVVVTPGTEFGAQFTDFVRLNFSQDHAAAIEAVRRICLMAGRYAIQQG